MKPRFSILALLSVTAYVAMVVAAVTMPGNQLLNAVAFYTWIGIVIFLAIEASQTTSPRSVFARGCFLTLIIYFLVTATTIDYLWPGPQPPSTYVAKWLERQYVAKSGTPGYAYKALVEFHARQYIWRHAIGNFALAFGSLGGALALWRYRVLERRQNTPT